MVHAYHLTASLEHVAAQKPHSTIADLISLLAALVDLADLAFAQRCKVYLVVYNHFFVFISYFRYVEVMHVFKIQNPSALLRWQVFNRLVEILLEVLLYLALLFSFHFSENIILKVLLHISCLFLFFEFPHLHLSLKHRCLFGLFELISINALLNSLIRNNRLLNRVLGLDFVPSILRFVRFNVYFDCLIAILFKQVIGIAMIRVSLSQAHNGHLICITDPDTL